MFLDLTYIPNWNMSYQIQMVIQFLQISEFLLLISRGFEQSHDISQSDASSNYQVLIEDVAFQFYYWTDVDKHSRKLQDW